MDKKKTYILICAAVATFLSIVLLVVTQRKEYPKSEFEYNKWNEPYSQSVHLDEMNFNIYRNYVELPVALIGLPEFIREIELPCDVRYYVHKEDSEPIIVLEKGSSVYVIPADKQYFGPGYGIECWPDYQKGWRYGQPFVTDERETSSYDAPKYYVRTSELEAVAKAFYKANSRLFGGQGVSASRYALVVTREIDVLLYKNGAFCSEELY